MQRRTSSMHIGTRSRETGGIRQVISYHTVHPSRASWNFPLCPQKCVHLAPSNPHISETAFSHRLQKYTHTPPPQRNEISAHRTKSSTPPRKNPGTQQDTQIVEVHMSCGLWGGGARPRYLIVWGGGVVWLGQRASWPLVR
jgi:hypothetical protein